MAYQPPEDFPCIKTDYVLGCNLSPGSPNLFSGEIEYVHYGYNVSKAAAIAFTVLFGVPTIIHLGLAFFFRARGNMIGLWGWLIPTLVFGGIGETLGWVGRAMSAYSVRWYPYAGGSWDSDYNGMMIQICCLIISPAFFAAWNYILLGELILRSAIRDKDGTIRCYSSFHPRGYTAVFVAGDVMSLAIQGLGGGIASSASTLSGANVGAKIMVGGIFIQLIIMLLYTGVLLEYAFRYLKNRPSPRLINLIGCCCCAWARREPAIKAITSEKRGTNGETSPPESAPATVTGPEEPRNKRIKYLLMLCSFTTLLLFIRSIFRSVELLDGWTGSIIENEGLFEGLDAAMMLILIWTYAIFHPGYFL